MLSRLAAAERQQIRCRCGRPARSCRWAPPAADEARGFAVASIAGAEFELPEAIRSRASEPVVRRTGRLGGVPARPAVSASERVAALRRSEPPAGARVAAPRRMQRAGASARGRSGAGGRRRSRRTSRAWRRDERGDDAQQPFEPPRQREEAASSRTPPAATARGARPGSPRSGRGGRGTDTDRPRTQRSMLRMSRSSGSSPSSTSARAASACERTPKTNVAPIRFSSDSPLADQGVADELGADDRHGQLRAPHPLQRGQQHPPDRITQQAPPLVEREHLQASPLSGHQVHREHRDQAHDLLPDALGLGVVDRGSSRLTVPAGRGSAGR